MGSLNCIAGDVFRTWEIPFFALPATVFFIAVESGDGVFSVGVWKDIVAGTAFVRISERLELAVS